MVRDLRVNNNGVQGKKAKPLREGSLSTTCRRQPSVLTSRKISNGAWNPDFDSFADRARERACTRQPAVELVKKKDEDMLRNNAGQGMCEGVNVNDDEETNFGAKPSEKGIAENVKRGV
jgi:hypothetical protein